MSFMDTAESPRRRPVVLVEVVRENHDVFFLTLEGAVVEGVAGLVCFAGGEALACSVGCTVAV